MPYFFPGCVGLGLPTGGGGAPFVCPGIDGKPGPGDGDGGGGGGGVGL